MSIRVGVVLDPIDQIKPHKDSTYAMMLEAQRRGWTVLVMEQQDLYLIDGTAFGRGREITILDEQSPWYSLAAPTHAPLSQLDAVLMRKDPPFDMEYVYTTYLLERAEQQGLLVLNRPQSLRDANEKLFTAWFPQCCAPTQVARDPALLREFLKDHQDIVIKPLDGMGGASIFRVRADDPNISVILETLTAHGTRFAMAQRYIPDIASKGDKRILLVDGEPVPYALARIPAPGESRGNLAAGASGVGVELSDRDRWICAEVAPELRRRGLVFVGLDVIGDYLTEINVTSPTCIRELDALFGLNIAGSLCEAVERKLMQKGR
jgi:glutathione synthase